MALPQASSPAYDELLDLLAEASSAPRILALKASPETQARVEYLLEKHRRDAVSPEEMRELEEFERLEHLVRMLKARVRQKQMR